MLPSVSSRPLTRAQHAIAACRVRLTAAHRRLARTGAAVVVQTRHMLAGLVHAGWRSTPAARSIASSGAATALAHDLARQGSPSFPAAVAASVLLHACLLAALLVMHHREPRASDVRSLAVTLTAEDPAVRVGERAGIAWNSVASRAAIAALLAARRDAALMDELVVTLVRRPHPATGSSSSTATASRTMPRAHATLAAATANPTPPPSAVPVGLPVVAAADPIAAPSAPPATTALAPSPPVASPMATPDERPATAAAPAQPGPPVPSATPPPAAASAPAAPAPPPTQPSQAAVAAAPPLERSATGDADRSYFDAVLRRLQRLKDYPGLARYHTSGRVEVAFRVARDGTVLTAEVHRSSGYSFLDKAGIDLIYRASPLPALPATLPGESWPIVVPISFRYD